VSPPRIFLRQRPFAEKSVCRWQKPTILSHICVVLCVCVCVCVPYMKFPCYRVVNMHHTGAENAIIRDCANAKMLSLKLFVLTARILKSSLRGPVRSVRHCVMKVYKRLSGGFVFSAARPWFLKLQRMTRFGAILTRKMFSRMSRCPGPTSAPTPCNLNGEACRCPALGSVATELRHREG
jgi:hypothetical protein